MKALIDADIFQYEFGAGEDSEGRTIPWPFVQCRINSRIDTILEATNSDSYQLYLTTDDKSNFRYKVATIQPYKGNRKGVEKPKYYTQIRNYLKDSKGAIEVSGMEADDAMAIEQYKDYKKCLNIVESNMYPWESNNYIEEILDTVICSRDKDLNMVPGYHYNWACGNQKESEIWFQSRLGGLKSFYKQMLTGDTVDNIPGIFGVGKASTLLKEVDQFDTEYQMISYVLGQYRKRFGSYAEQFFTENAQLLWMLSYEGEVKTFFNDKNEIEDGYC